MKEAGRLAAFFAAVVIVIIFCVNMLGAEGEQAGDLSLTADTNSEDIISDVYLHTGWQQMQDNYAGNTQDYLENEESSSGQYINTDEYLANEEYLTVEYDDSTVPVHSGIVVSGVSYTLEQLSNFDFLINNMYIVDSSTKAKKEIFDTAQLLAADMTIAKNKRKPQILIYHTHASEAFLDSRKGESEDTVVGVGAYLAQLLEDMDYVVLHDTTVYDMKDGVDNRNYAYSTARPCIEKILEENPSIEVVIDLHRDSGEKRIVEIDGQSVAQIMLFNGLCRDSKGEPLSNLENKNITGNLAFSLQLKITGDKLYPGLMKKIYLKNYRYNMHFREKNLLVELGTQKNTVAEAYAAMPYFAEILAGVLSQEQ